jgi:frataxin-like iron-binding protein CyaY
MKYQNIIIDGNNLFWRSVSSTIKKIIEQDDEDLFYSITIQDSLDRIEQLLSMYGNDETQIYILHDNPFSKIWVSS